MENIKVKLHTPNDAALFVAKCNFYDFDIDYCYGRLVLDAKSLMGVLSVGLEQKCSVVLHTNDTSKINTFQNDIKLWIVEE